MSATLMTDLEHDWADLIHTRSFVDDLTHLTQEVTDLKDLGRTRLPGDVADALLHRLLVEHTRTGSYPAGRAVLQCMLPAIKSVVARGRRHYPDINDLAQEAAAAMWDAITTYDPGHTDRVAMRLQGHMLTRVIGDRSPHARSASRTVRGGGLTEIATEADTLAALERHDTVDTVDVLYSPTAHTLGATGEVLDAIAWGLDVDAITPDEASMLTRLYAPDPSLPEYDEIAHGRGKYQARIAAELGISHATLRQRASRAVRRLAEAVQAAL
jgi:hypothetical protein